MAYALMDFTESLARTHIDPETVHAVLLAWGDSQPDGSWEGGFVLLFVDGRIGILTGWCDTTGWGCQDGASIAYVDAPPFILNAMPSGASRDAAAQWVRMVARLDVRSLLATHLTKSTTIDDAPIDLNRWLFE